MPLHGILLIPKYRPSLRSWELQCSLISQLKPGEAFLSHLIRPESYVPIHPHTWISFLYSYEMVVLELLIWVNDSLFIGLVAPCRWKQFTFILISPIPAMVLSSYNILNNVYWIEKQFYNNWHASLALPLKFIIGVFMWEAGRHRETDSEMESERKCFSQSL